MLGSADSTLSVRICFLYTNEFFKYVELVLDGQCFKFQEPIKVLLKLGFRKIIVKERFVQLVRGLPIFGLNLFRRNDLL